GEPLVVAEVEVGLRTVVGDEDLAVLVGRHGPGIDIEIGVELAQPYLVAARLQQRAERCRCETLAEGGDHAAADEDVPRHGAYPLAAVRRSDESAQRPSMRQPCAVRISKNPCDPIEIWGDVLM